MNQTNNSTIDANNGKEQSTRRAYVAPELKNLSSEKTQGKNSTVGEANGSTGAIS